MSDVNPAEYYFPRPDLAHQFCVERNIVVPLGYEVQVWHAPLSGKLVMRMVEVGS